RSRRREPADPAPITPANAPLHPTPRHPPLPAPSIHPNPASFHTPAKISRSTSPEFLHPLSLLRHSLELQPNTRHASLPISPPPAATAASGTTSPMPVAPRGPRARNSNSRTTPRPPTRSAAAGSTPSTNPRSTRRPKSRSTPPSPPANGTTSASSFRPRNANT